MKKIFTVAAILGLPLLGGGIVYASTAPAEPARAYGGCVSKSTGYVRVLERNALTKSVNGKCRSTERKITFYSRSGVDALVKPLSKFQITLDGVTAVCTRGANTAAGVPAYTCTKPSPTPTPTS